MKSKLFFFLTIFSLSRFSQLKATTVFLNFYDPIRTMVGVSLFAPLEYGFGLSDNRIAGLFGYNFLFGKGVASAFFRPSLEPFFGFSGRNAGPNASVLGVSGVVSGGGLFTLGPVKLRLGIGLPLLTAALGFGDNSGASLWLIDGNFLHFFLGIGFEI
jgi:hypothetical protein